MMVFDLRKFRAWCKDQGTPANKDTDPWAWQCKGATVEGCEMRGKDGELYFANPFWCREVPDESPAAPPES